MFEDPDEQEKSIFKSIKMASNRNITMIRQNKKMRVKRHTINASSIGKCRLHQFNTEILNVQDLLSIKPQFSIDKGFNVSLLVNFQPYYEDPKQILASLLVSFEDCKEQEFDIQVQKVTRYLMQIKNSFKDIITTPIIHEQ